jgi:hypothetical protein
MMQLNDYLPKVKIQSKCPLRTLPMLQLYKNQTMAISKILISGNDGHCFIRKVTSNTFEITLTAMT